ncbi:MAG: DNA mismatch repair endonuclease MutL [Hungatella sp.]
MTHISVLDQNTINKIAAGEVIERPSSVVKELLENAIDARATAITVEIKEGGISFIRVTDNGCGIPKEDVPLAFLPHSTSKIKSVEDLFMVSSLGFRGEALSSIAAIAQVELITKTDDQLTGIRYQIEGGEERSLEEIGAPEGTTFLVRNLFFHTPARKKFLKTAQTEGAHIEELVEKIALSHPDVSIRLIQNNQNKLHTSGNHNLKDMIYTIFGREIAANLLPMEVSHELLSVRGFIGKPVIVRGNRNYENYFINGRYIKSSLISKAIEEAYKPFLMQHKYPFALLHLSIEPEYLDVNVHPTKMELRFRNEEQIYELLYQAIHDVLAHQELIPEVNLERRESGKIMTPETTVKAPRPEPFETKRFIAAPVTEHKLPVTKPIYEAEPSAESVQETPTAYLPAKQLDLFEEKLLEPKNRLQHKLIGQIFDTYWLVEFHEQLYIIDQHAAHEKVLYERTIRSLKERDYTSQMVNPPIILTLSSKEEVLLKKHLDYFTEIGFEIEPFGGKEYAVRAVPDNLFRIAKKELLMEMIDGLSDEISSQNPDVIYERVASMSCKAAVKGNHALSMSEANELIDQLLELDNPYACPHGRPTIISMSKYELEKKFKRIL